MPGFLAMSVPTLARCAGLVYALLCCASHAVAQPAPPPVNMKQYQTVVRRAVDQFDRGHYERAKALFTEAHQIFPNARTLRGLGMVAYTARDYVQAIPLLESAIASQVKPLDPPLIVEAREVIDRCRGFIGIARVRLVPSEAQLLVNAAPAALAGDGSIALNPGSYEVEAHAPGYLSATRLVRIEPGVVLELDLTLPRDSSRDVAVPQPVAPREVASATAPEPEPAQVPAPPLDAPPPSESSASVAPWILTGISGAVAVGGGVLLGIALSDVRSVERASPTTDWSSVENEFERSPAMSAIGIAMIGAGVAGIAVGITWHFLETPAPESLALEASPFGARVRVRW